MPSDIVEHNALSPADIVSAMDVLIRRGQEGESVEANLAQALDMLDEAECRSTSDALALLSVARTLTADAALRVSQDEQASIEVLKAACRYQDAAMSFLEAAEAYERSEEIRGGATIN
ncbi:hypothetical protein C8J35_103523 [Rhizobium sp. PP-F2F-G38]|nr:hypothetical protein C8J35_103523 [Rhizobium sp. PP-F2F-G38]